MLLGRHVLAVLVTYMSTAGHVLYPPEAVVVELVVAAERRELSQTDGIREEDLSARVRPHLPVIDTRQSTESVNRHVNQPSNPDNIHTRQSNTHRYQ